MDLWDLTKVMFRRWYITAPMVLATIAAAAWLTTSTGPEYEASGHVAVIPPEVQRVAEAGEMLRVSPWNEEALAHAAQIRLEAKRLQDDLAEQGYHGEWSVEVSGRLPVVSMEVVAPTAEQALDTLHRLQAVVAEEVRIRQEEYAVPAEEQIRTVVYDTGESVDTSASGLRRALVAALGAGAVLTIAVVMAFDAIALARRRRKDRAVGVVGSPPQGGSALAGWAAPVRLSLTPPGGVAPTVTGPAQWPATLSSVPYPSGNGRAAAATHDTTVVMPAPAVDPSRAPAGPGAAHRDGGRERAKRRRARYRMRAARTRRR